MREFERLSAYKEVPVSYVTGTRRGNGFEDRGVAVRALRSVMRCQCPTYAAHDKENSRDAVGAWMRRLS